jgi:DNA-binding GntR family transcriptional regulator
VAAVGGPDYQRVIDDLKRQITSGELQIGDPIPSDPKLQAIYKVSSSVTRPAVNALKAEGILEGHQGKAVTVVAIPGKTSTVRSLQDEVDELRQKQEAIAEHVAELKAHLMDLYARVAEEYPGDAGAETTPTRHRDTGT